MQIMTAIREADALCPNPYSLSEKLRWCDEVSAAVRREIIKIYNVITATWDGCGSLILPPGIMFEDIEALYIGNRLVEKSDFRTIAKDFSPFSESVFSHPAEVRAVCLTRPSPIRETEIKGTFDTNEDFIAVESPPFIEGDTISFVCLSNADDEPDWSSAAEAQVVGTSPEGIFLDEGSIEAQSSVLMVIKREISDYTEVDEAPYDGMYIEYILAKMALYQHDYTGYGAHMAQYNSLFDSMKRDYKTRMPLNGISNFKNYWR